MENENKFNCKYCTLTFTMKRNKKRHEQEIHGVESRSRNFTCEMCSSNFGRRSDLKKHKKKYHVAEVNAKVTNKESSKSKGTFVKIPDYSDISEDENWEDDNNNSNSECYQNKNIPMDLGNDAEHDGDVHAEGEKSENDNFGFGESVNNSNANNDFLNMTDQEYAELKSSLIVNEDIRTVTLTLIKTEQRFLDGSVKVKRETSVGYSENVDKNKLNMQDIVKEVLDQVNDFVNPNNKNVPDTFYTL